MSVPSLSESVLATEAGEVARGLRELLPAIRARRQEIETARQLPRDLVEQLRGTGVFALGVPRALGGREASPLELMTAIETVSSADGSTGWCTMVGTANNVSAGYLDERGAREVWSDPGAPTAGLAAPAGAAVPVQGGVRVTGRWPFASGITHSAWAWLGCLRMDNGQPRLTDGAPDIIHVCVPVAELEIHDTWYVSGLAGTGSHDVSASDVFVPEHRIFRLLDPAGHRHEPLYQLPSLQLFILQLASVSLGIARAALDELGEVAQTKQPSLYQTVLADHAVVQVQLAHAEAELGGARAFLHAVAGELWHAATAGAAPSPRQLARARIAAVHAVEVGARVTRSAATLAGGSAIYRGSPFQRHARDAEAITHHFTVAPQVWEESGRVLLGRAPTVPVF